MQTIFIYRVVDANGGPFVSAWRLTKGECKKIIKNLANDPIFGGNQYIIETSSMMINADSL